MPYSSSIAIVTLIGQVFTLLLIMQSVTEANWWIFCTTQRGKFPMFIASATQERVSAIHQFTRHQRIGVLQVLFAWKKILKVRHEMLSRNDICSKGSRGTKTKKRSYNYVLRLSSYLLLWWHQLNRKEDFLMFFKVVEQLIHYFTSSSRSGFLFVLYISFLEVVLFLTANEWTEIHLHKNH